MSEPSLEARVAALLRDTALCPHCGGEARKERLEEHDQPINALQTEREWFCCDKCRDMGAQRHFTLDNRVWYGHSFGWHPLGWALNGKPRSIEERVALTLLGKVLCPICGADSVPMNDLWFCKNPNCDVRSHRNGVVYSDGWLSREGKRETQ